MISHDFPSLSALHRSSCEKYGPRSAIRFKRDGVWHRLTWCDYRREADHVAAGLIELGIQPGERVAILSENRWEWLVADHAILSIGAVVVPIHSPSTPAQVQYVLNHCGASAILVSTASQWEKVLAIRANLPELRFAVAFDAISNGPERTWDGVAQLGQRACAAGCNQIATREAELTPDSLATLVYTSGTTRSPKGVMLTHGNLLSNSVAAAAMDDYDGFSVWLNWLPLSHIFARLVDHYGTTRMGMTVAMAQSAMTVMDDIAEVQPSFFSSVPRLLEKAWADLAALPADQRPTRAKQLFGKQLKRISSGGAPLAMHVMVGFKESGVLVLEGYGLTETSPIISFNQRGNYRFGTVGQPVDGVEVRIADDSEILTRGPHVMRGYWNDPEGTAAAIQDGWFHTGDLGALDSDNFLSITGRKKDLIVTAGGKNIAPVALEALLIRDPFIEQAIVHGDSRPFVSAIIVPKFASKADIERESGGTFVAGGDVVTDPKLLEWFQSRVDVALRDVSHVERARKIIVLNRPLSLDLDELTVTQKVRRSAVFARYQSQLDALYQGTSE